MQPGMGRCSDGACSVRPCALHRGCASPHQRVAAWGQTGGAPSGGPCRPASERLQPRLPFDAAAVVVPRSMRRWPRRQRPATRRPPLGRRRCRAPPPIACCPAFPALRLCLVVVPVTLPALLSSPTQPSRRRQRLQAAGSDGRPHSLAPLCGRGETVRGVRARSSTCPLHATSCWRRHQQPDGPCRSTVAAAGRRRRWPSHVLQPGCLPACTRAVARPAPPPGCAQAAARLPLWRFRSGGCDAARGGCWLAFWRCTWQRKAAAAVVPARSGRRAPCAGAGALGPDPRLLLRVLGVLGVLCRAMTWASPLTPMRTKRRRSCRPRAALETC